MLRFINAFALVALAAAAHADAFGRYGYGAPPDVPGMSVDRDGFAAKHPLADKIRFVKPLAQWKPVATSEFGQTVGFGQQDFVPSKGRFTTTAPGFALYFGSGIRLHVASTAAPYLTWTDGSVTSGVPTPPVRWLVVSFQTSEPPVLLGFPGDPASLVVRGRPADWTIQTDGDFKGWVRVGLPLGQRPVVANTAADLGKLAQAVAAEADLYTQMSPEPVGFRLDHDQESVTATWSFDRPGATVPIGATLAGLGQYPLSIQSSVKRIDAPTDEGPLDVLSGKDLTIRFPVRRVPTGRALALGAQPGEPIGTVAPQDIPSVVELALEGLLAERDVQTRKAADDTLTEYLGQATYAAEPVTGQQLPYTAAGEGADLAAAHALLMQSILSTQRATSEGNSLLTSLQWRRDWATWRFWGASETVARRVGALAALAGAICPEPERRLQAAMFQAGLSAERGLDVWRRRNGFATGSDATFAEPEPGLRQGLFGLRVPPEPDSAFALALRSPIRIFGDASATLTQDVSTYVLQWPVLEAKPSLLTLAAAFPFSVKANGNLTSLKVAAALGFTELRYVPEVAGTCEVRLTVPKWAKPLPKATPVPSYREPSR